MGPAGPENISIHAPHEGVRRLRDREANIDNISIHAPHEGVRHSLMCLVERLYRFQSTHPTRGCDRNLRCSVSAQIFQSTHPTRGCDTGSCFDSSAFLFQSTHPTRGCDFNTFAPRLHNQFQSTHPTRGCDDQGRRCRQALGNFNPRTPRGGAT